MLILAAIGLARYIQWNNQWNKVKRARYSTHKSPVLAPRVDENQHKNWPRQKVAPERVVNGN